MQQANNINITPKQLMAFTVVVLSFMAGMVFFTTSQVANVQKVSAQQTSGTQTNNAQPQFLVSEKGVKSADACVDPEATEAAAYGVGDTVTYNGKTYTIVGAVPSTTQINEDNDSYTTITTNIHDNGNTDNRYSGNTDNRNSGNTNVDNRNSGNTTTDNRNSGNTDVLITNNGNTNTDNRNSGNTTNNTDNRNSGNTTNNTSNSSSTTVTNTNNGNTNTTNSGNTNNSGNTTNSGNISL